jgi:hypothetical protein
MMSIEGGVSDNSKRLAVFAAMKEDTNNYADLQKGMNKNVNQLVLPDFEH